MLTCIQMECFMPYFALIIMSYHVKIACYQYVYMDKCMHICIYVSLYIYKYMCMYVGMHVLNY